MIERVVDQWLDRKSDPQPAAKHEIPVTAAAAPLSSFKDLQPPSSKPVAFVCEEDVRAAMESKVHIVLGKKTIVTPSARELGEANDIFVTAD